MSRAIESMCLKTALLVPVLQKLCDLTSNILPRDLCPGTGVSIKEQTIGFVKTDSPPGSGTVQ